MALLSHIIWNENWSKISVTFVIQFIFLSVLMICGVIKGLWGLWKSLGWQLCPEKGILMLFFDILILRLNDSQVKHCHFISHCARKSVRWEAISVHMQSPFDQQGIFAIFGHLLIAFSFVFLFWCSHLRVRKHLCFAHVKRADILRWSILFFHPIAGV